MASRARDGRSGTDADEDPENQEADACERGQANAMRENGLAVAGASALSVVDGSLPISQAVSFVSKAVPFAPGFPDARGSCVLST